jgi:hypothetical protein
MKFDLLLVATLAAVAGCAPAPEPQAVRLAFPGAAGSAQPRLTQHPDGDPVLSWLEPDGDAHVLRYARYRAGQLQAPREVARSDRMFVNWADFPSVTPITDDLWFAHWLRLKAGSYTYDIATSISVDGGLSWSAAEQMNEDETEAEHGFVSVFPWDDRIAAFWLDGRELANWSFDEPDALLGVSLRLARYDANGTVTEREVTDELVCDCCQPDVAVAGGIPVVAYRDRTEEEIRDVVVRRFIDGAWSEAVSLGNEQWYLEGCPVNGPAIAARGSELAVAWFTAADNQARVRIAQSHDAGVSFDPVIDADTRGSLGQTGLVVDDDGRALLSWWRRGQMGGIDLMVRAYARDGKPGEEILVAHEDIGQAIDVPQLIAAGKDYLVAWTTLDDEGAVRLASLEL